MLNYIKPLLDIIQNTCPNFDLKYWNSEKNVVNNKVITYYTKLNTVEGYNTDAIFGSIYVDIWAKNMNDIADAENALYLALRHWQYENMNIFILIDKVGFNDFGEERNTELNRVNGQIDIRILFVTE
ncbi:hypothetical protein [Clostridium sp. JN-9]|uniref:hypothetical protein n=1 Tax=Clostridium sp. JN-9 TaxID=2507159 RepID=UPI000FFE31F1|nr:hypothetical protein [Clostridium sp. JN-9]QAT39534.1 hypothetical protein EQM05_04305 [Clostridium sp. JN-9]